MKTSFTVIVGSGGDAGNAGHFNVEMSQAQVRREVICAQYLLEVIDCFEQMRRSRDVTVCREFHCDSRTYLQW
jgi:hypothetical protein